MHAITKPSIAKLVPPGKAGKVEVDHFTIGKPDVRMMLYPREYISPGTYARLHINGSTIMSDTDDERRTNREAVHCANGDVLIAGLGIGMVLVPILQKPDVRSVTVLELHQDVMGLVVPHLKATLVEDDRKELNVLHADVFTWEPPKGRRWDTIYFDIWGDQSTDDLESMTKLKRRYARRLNRDNPRAWMGCWREDELRRRAKHDQRNGW